MSRPGEGHAGQREQRQEGAQDPGTREHLGAGVLKGFMPPWQTWGDRMRTDRASTRSSGVWKLGNKREPSKGFEQGQATI